jgi:hypothetical protein
VKAVDSLHRSYFVAIIERCFQELNSKGAVPLGGPIYVNTAVVKFKSIAQKQMCVLFLTDFYFLSKNRLTGNTKQET